MSPVGTAAQTDAENGPQEQGAIDYLNARAECLSHYHFGSVHFVFDESDQQQTLTAGDNLEIDGQLRNMNDYPLSQTRMLVRILREDQEVADENWHPVVAEKILDEEYDLAAHESRPFDFSWLVPAHAPSGLYRAEFFYLAGDRYPIAGVPYVPNVAGGSVLFTIRDIGVAAAVSFDRSSIKLNGESIALRSIPAALSSDKPVSITVDLDAEGDAAVPLQLRSSLYEWSDIDAEPALLDSTTFLTVKPGKSIEIPFNWDKPKAGVYELVLTAAPRDQHILPSILKVRFPVAGSAPRIIYSGIGGYSDSDAIITTCVVNGTFGSPQGSITTRVVSENGLIQEKTSAKEKYLGTMNLRIPLDQLAGVVSVEAEARNEQGEITDTHQITYPANALTAPQGSEDASTQYTPKQKSAMKAMLAALAILVIIAIVTVMKIKKRTSL
jgi:hypothetical protein